MPTAHHSPSRQTRSVTRWAFSGCATLLLCAACGQQKPEELLASADGYLAKHDRKAAIIQIKNAIQADPDSGRARYLLGTALLEEGDPVQAEIELRKALRLGYSRDLVVPKLAETLLAHAESQKLVDEFGSAKLDGAPANAALATSLASAFAALGNLAKADSTIGNALSFDPAYVPALLLRARMRMANNDLAGASEIAGTIVRTAPDRPEGWKLKGDIDSATSHDASASLESYRKSVALRPDFLPAQLAIARILLQGGKLEEAKKEVEVLKKIRPNDLQVRYIEAALAFALKDIKNAQAQVLQLLKTSPNSVQILLLAGSVELARGAMAEAQMHLGHALDLAPDNIGARRLLVSAFLRTGQPTLALAALHRGRTDQSVDPTLYAVAGDAYLQSGDAKTAQDFFAKAAQLDPKNSKNRTSLAVARLRNGEAESGLVELQQVSAADSGTSADLALISAYMARQQGDKALAAIDVLDRKQPNQPLAPFLRGRVRMAQHESIAARENFARALAIAPKYFPAAASLTAMDVADDKLPEAKARLRDFIAQDPANSKALMALAELDARTGATADEVARAVQKAITADPADPAPRLMLIRLHLKSGDAKQAVTVAQTAVAALPDRPEILEALGEAQQRAGDRNQAVASFARAAEMQPTTARAYVRLASAQLENKSSSQAEQTLQRALTIEPGSLGAQRLLAGLYVDTARVPAALNIARALQTQRPKDSVGYAMEGDIDAFTKDKTAAVAAYRSGLKQAPSTELAVKLHRTLTSSGMSSAADRFAMDWQKQHPRDAAFLFYLGDAAIQRKDYSTAQAHYKSVLALQPEHAAALNNLAWLANELHQPDAIALAEKANKIAPNQTSFMDTLASALAEAKRYDEAIKVQQQAVTLQPGDPNLRLGLAKLFVKTGDKGSARSNLDQLAALGPKFASQAEVSKMLHDL